MAKDHQGVQEFQEKMEDWDKCLIARNRFLQLYGPTTRRGLFPEQWQSLSQNERMKLAMSAGLVDPALAVLFCSI